MSSPLGTVPAGALLLALDLAGTAVFVVSGAAVGVKHRLDVFGVCVLAVVAGVGGGMIRDVLIGAVPPAALAGRHYVTVALGAGLITFWCHPGIERLRNPILVFDAAGLALFAVSGTQKALGFGLHPVVAALLGMLTGIGGGILRDLLVSEIPTVLRSELYALAALAGAAVVVAGHWLPLPAALVTLAGAALCFAIRIAALRRGWNLPVARGARDGRGARPTEGRRGRQGGPRRPDVLSMRGTNESLLAGPVRAGSGERQDDQRTAPAHAADRVAIERWEDEGGRALRDDSRPMSARRGGRRSAPPGSEGPTPRSGEIRRSK